MQARDAWLRWWRDIEGAGLLQELKKRTRPDLDPDKVQALVRKMGDATFEVREQAQKDLVRLGVPVLPLLGRFTATLRTSKSGCGSGPPSRRSRRITPKHGKNTFPGSSRGPVDRFAQAAGSGRGHPRLSAVPGRGRAAGGAPESLLPPSLSRAARRDRRSLKALTDRSGTRRIAAARVLCAVPRPHHLEKVRQLLRDPEPAVRLAVAVALADARDPAGLTALASLVAQAPAELAPQAEDYLSQLAGEAGPKDLPQGEDNRPKRGTAWEAWVKDAKNNPAVFGPVSDGRERVGPAGGSIVRGYTLLVQPQLNTVTELGLDGKPRWSLTGLQGPNDALVLANQHVLIAEQNRVTERDLRGTILWKFEDIQPIGVQRLPNGNTFIPCNGEILEVDRAGKGGAAGGRAGRRSPPRNGCATAGSSPSTAATSSSWTRPAARSSAFGGDVRRRRLQRGAGQRPRAGPVAGQRQHDRVRHGRQRGGPFRPARGRTRFRLPNGHTLVTIEQGRFVELDKKLKPVKETALPAPTFRVKQR